MIRVLIYYLRWAFGIIFLINGLISILTQPFYGFIALALALMLVPYSERLILKKSGISIDSRVKMVLVFLLFLLMVAVFESPDSGSSEDDSGTVQGVSDQISELPTVTETQHEQPTQTPVPTQIPDPTATQVPPTMTPPPEPTAPLATPTATQAPPPPTWTPQPLPTDPPVQQQQFVPQESSYVCDCSKTCSRLSCDEAYYQLNQCGCSVRDGDSDGIPCESICL